MYMQCPSCRVMSDQERWEHYDCASSTHLVCPHCNKEVEIGTWCEGDAPTQQQQEALRLIGEFQELNISNYNEEDIARINNWACDAFTFISNL